MSHTSYDWGGPVTWNARCSWNGLALGSREPDNYVMLWCPGDFSDPRPVYKVGHWYRWCSQSGWVLLAP